MFKESGIMNEPIRWWGEEQDLRLENKAGTPWKQPSPGKPNTSKINLSSPNFDQMSMEMQAEAEAQLGIKRGEAWANSLQPENKPATNDDWLQYADLAISALPALFVREPKRDSNTEWMQMANTPFPNGNKSQALMKAGGKLKANDGLQLPMEGGNPNVKSKADNRTKGIDLLNMAISEGRNPKDIILNPELQTGRTTYLEMLNNALGEEKGRLAYTAAAAFSQKKGVDKMTKEDRLKSFYGGLSNNPELSKLKEEINNYTGTNTALSLYSTSPLIGQDGQAPVLAQNKLEPGGTLTGDDPKIKLPKLNKRQVSDQTRITNINSHKLKELFPGASSNLSYPKQKGMGVFSPEDKLFDITGSASISDAINAWNDFKNEPSLVNFAQGLWETSGAVPLYGTGRKLATRALGHFLQYGEEKLREDSKNNIKRINAKMDAGGSINETIEDVETEGDPEKPFYRDAADKKKYQENLIKLSRSGELKAGNPVLPYLAKGRTQIKGVTNESLTCIDGVCGIMEKAGKKWNAGTVNQHYIGNETFYDNVYLNRKEDAYAATGNFQVGDIIQATHEITTQLKNGKTGNRVAPYDAKLIVDIQEANSGDPLFITSGGSGSTTLGGSSYRASDLKKLVQSKERVVTRPGYALDKEKLKMERQGGEKVAKILEERKIKEKKSAVKHDTYRELLSDKDWLEGSYNTTKGMNNLHFRDLISGSWKYQNFNDFSVNEKGVSELIKKGGAFSDLSSSYLKDNKLLNTVISKMNDENYVMDMAKKYDLSPFEVTKMLRQVGAVGFVESRLGDSDKRGLKSNIKYTLEELMPESMQKQSSIGPFQLRYNALPAQTRERLGNDVSNLYDNEKAIDATMDSLFEFQKILKTKLKRGEVKDLKGLTAENIIDYAPMMMNHYSNGKVIPFNFDNIESRAGQIKELEKLLFLNKGKIVPNKLRKTNPNK